jgi:ribosomal protein S18 acetylase RimI-like enzyme
VEAAARTRPQYEDVKDRAFYDRWMSSLRGSAYLVTDPSSISDNLGPSDERQILGKVKPVFSVSAPVRGYNPLTSERTRKDEWGNVSSALMARAIRLEKEGKTVTPASVLGARRDGLIGDTSSPSGRLSSGSRVPPRQRKMQLQKVDDAKKYLRNLDLQIAEVDLTDSETGEKIKSPIFSVAGRPMVLVDVNGIRIPFYQSTGKGGKENPTGKWYPIFGVGKSDLIFDREFKRFVDRGGWFNKGDTYESIDNYYDVPEFKRIATILNDIDDLTKINFYDVGVVASEGETLELLKKNGSTGYASSKLPKARMSVNDDLLKVINRDLTPYSTVGDAERSGGRRWDYINSVIDRIEKNRVKLDINSVSVAVDKDKLSVSKESNRIKNRDVQLTVKDKNGDAIKVSIESELETRFDDREVQNVTVRMRSNGTQVGVLYARTDIRGELGNQDKLTISDILVPEDYHRRGHGRLMLSLAEKYNIGSEKINHSSKLSELGELFAGGTGSDSGRLSSGARSGTSRTQRVAGIAGGRATGRVLDAVLKRSGADEDTRERVKYGINMAGALAAGGPAGFATALAVDVSRRAGREIAERGLEEAVQRGKITQQQMDVAMQAVNRVAPNGLPDPVVDKLADAWSVASDFIDERVATDENMQRLDEFGDVIRASGSEFVTNAGEVVDSAREKIGKRFRRGKNSKSATDSFSGSDDNTYEPAKTEFDDFSDPFSSGKRAGRSADAFRGEYNSRIGISKSTPNSAKPVSGYVVHRSHNEEKKRQIAASGKGNIGSDAIFEIGDTDVVGDGLTALGEIEVILKPEVSDRTSYGRGEALQSAHRPVSMNSSDADDIADAMFNADGISSKEQNTEAMLHLLGAKMDKNFSSVGASRDENGKMSPVGMVDSGTRGHEPFEAQILGGFKKNEVEGIHYPYSKVSKIAESEDISDVVSQNSMKSKLEKLGFTPEEIAYFYSMSGGKPINTASMTKLKEYRAAKKIKEQYEGMGIGYVKFAHPQGINIENPRSYDKTANQNARVDEILKKAIDAEIDVELKKTLDSIRKGQQLDLVVD